MPIYYLDKDPLECAKAHNDRHVKQQSLNLGLLLSSIHIEYGRDTKVTGKIYAGPLTDADSEGCFGWLERSKEAYHWTWHVWKFLLDEHLYRFQKEHPSKEIIDLLKDVPEKRKGLKLWSPPPCLVPHKFLLDNNKKKVREEALQISCLNSYRNWYGEIHTRADGFTRRPVPVWSPYTVSLTPSGTSPNVRMNRVPQGTPVLTPTGIQWLTTSGELRNA